MVKLLDHSLNHLTYNMILLENIYIKNHILFSVTFVSHQFGLLSHSKKNVVALEKSTKILVYLVLESRLL